MIESWLVSPSEKLKKQCSEKTCLLLNGDEGIGHLLLTISSYCFHHVANALFLLVLYIVLNLQVFPFDGKK